LKNSARFATIITYLKNYYQDFMSQVKIQKELIAEILERGVEKLYPNRLELEKKLKSGESLRIYCGFDPSAKSLHIGNAIALAKLRQFQLAGHKIIFLIGSFTGMIGDPTDKGSARKQLSREEVMTNAINFQAQASAYISFVGENPAELQYNHEWHDQLSFKDLIETTAHFTVQQMIQRDMFQERLKEERPIFLHEFLYPIAQAYDSVVLDVDFEVGGNDQMFNMMCGRALMKSLKNKDKGVLTMKLLTDNEGKKMGKSEGNIVMLDEDPINMYAKVMSWPDNVLTSAFELCTLMSWPEAKKIVKEITSPRDLKMRLALEITQINHGEIKALEAQSHFVKTVQNKEVPEEIIEVSLAAGKYNLIDLLALLKLVASKGEARRLIKQGGIKLGSGDKLEVQMDEQKEIELTQGLIIQRGKRQFVRVLIK
jgi:tyrosyl-tRNA synthetase